MGCFNDLYTTKTLTTSGTSAQYPTGTIWDTSDGTTNTSVDEIDLGAGSGTGGTPGTGLHQQAWLNLAISSVTGTGTLTLDVAVETDDNTSFSSATTRFSAPQISSTQNTSLNAYYSWPLPYLPERYARIKLTPGGTTPAWAVTASITSGGDSMFVS